MCDQAELVGKFAFAVLTGSTHSSGSSIRDDVLEVAKISARSIPYYTFALRRPSEIPPPRGSWRPSHPNETFKGVRDIT